MDNQNQNQNQKPDGSDNRMPKWPLLLAVGVIVILMIAGGARLCGSLIGEYSEEITYDEFLKYIENDQVSEVVLNDFRSDNARWELKLKDDKQKTYNCLEFGSEV